jgi:hypothetical protein
MHFYDVIGMSGVALILYSYAALHFGKMRLTGFAYSSLNLLGSLAIAFSLLYQWNLASFIIEIVWTSISLYGLCNYFINKKKHQKTKE